MSRFAPNAHMTAIIDDWAPYYIARTQAVLDGTWKSEDTFGGFDSGMVKMGPMNANLPADVVSMAKAAEEEIRSGKLHPFAGPITKQDGSIVAADGSVLPIGDQLGMNFYVQGVEGQIPG